MGLLKKATNGTAYLKLGILGFEGSGKTFTAVDFAIGWTNLLKGNKVAFFDTEKGSDFHIKRFEESGIQLDVVKSRAFKDLVATIKEAEVNGYSFLIIDSISHIWRDLVQSYLKTRNRNFLTIKDWGILKTEWGQYTDAYVNSKIAIAMLGRAGYEYETEEDEDGVVQMSKAGTKMKVEGETGFEPDLLLEMFKAPRINMTQIKGKKRVKRERGFVNKCVVLKDRTNTMNGMEIEMPSFKDFKPVLSALNIGGDHEGVDVNRNSEDIFDNPKTSWSDREKRKQIAVEEIQELLTLNNLDGRSGDATKERTKLLIQFFGTSTKTGIENKRLEELQDGLSQMRNFFNEKIKDTFTEDILAPPSPGETHA